MRHVFGFPSASSPSSESVSSPSPWGGARARNLRTLIAVAWKGNAAFETLQTPAGNAGLRKVRLPRRAVICSDRMGSERSGGRGEGD